MTEEAIADVLEVSSRTVARDWDKARLFLSVAFEQTSP